jgi:shikimate kinase
MGNLKEISSFKRRELSYELGKEGPNNYGIVFKGQKKFWKVVSSKKLADRVVATLKRRGKDADVIQTAAQTTEEAVYPHKMYDLKTGKAHVAKTPEDHERMSKLGYTKTPEKEESIHTHAIYRALSERVDYLTLNQIKKEWSKEYPGTKFKFQVSKYKGMERLAVLSPDGYELEVYDRVPGQGWTIQETTDKTMKGLDENDRTKLAALYNKALKHMPHSPAQNKIRKEIEALRKKMKIDEGVDDPAIFKVVFLAGGPGSGKSFTVGKTGLSALGFRIINSDDIFEFSLKKAGMGTTQKDIYSPKGQKIRVGAKKLTAKKMDLYLNGRLGLVIDGTGKDFTKIQKWAVSLKEIGYDIGMIFVNTNLETAIARDKKRGRTLGDKKVTKMWQEVQDNLGKFQNLFGTEFVIVDNSEGANYEKATLNAYKKMSKFAKTPPRNPIAKKWIKDAGGRLKDSYSIHINRLLKMVEHVIIGDEELKLQIAESITVESKPSEIKQIFKGLHRKYENDKRRK